MLYRPIAYVTLPLLTALIGAGASAQTSDSVLPAPVQLAQQTVIVAPAAPPPPQTEVIPAPPASDAQPAYWRPGHWSWTLGGWVWVAGSYVTPPQPTAAWVPGQWMTQPSGGYVWVDGHWQS